MKRATTSPGFTPEQIKAAIKAAPERVRDPDSAYDPNDAKSVAAFFKDAVFNGTILRKIVFDISMQRTSTVGLLF